MNTDQLITSVQDNTTQATGLDSSIVFVQGESTRGKVNKPDTIITSWPQFKKLFGKPKPTDSTYAHDIQRMFEEYGVSMRFNRLSHYSDVSDTTTISAVKATLSKITNAGFTHTLTIDGAILSDNIVKITINSVPYEIPYNTSSNQTLQNVANIFLNDFGPFVETAVVPNVLSGPNNARTVVVTQKTSTPMMVLTSISIVNAAGVTETRAIGSVKFTNAGAANNFASANFDGTLYAQIQQDATASLTLAQLAVNYRNAINSSVYTGTAAIDGADNTKVNITAPSGTGAAYNGKVILVNPTSPLAVTIVNFAGGITAVAQGTLKPSISSVTNTPVVTTIINATGETLFQVALNFHGVDGNNFRFDIKAPSNGVTGFFNIELSHLTDSTILEKYENLQINGKFAIESLDFLRIPSSQTDFLTFTYNNLTGISGNAYPAVASYGFVSGSDGTSVNDTDRIGSSSAKTGLYAFSPYKDSYIFMHQGALSDLLIQNISSFVSLKDLAGFITFPSGGSASSIKTLRDSTGVDNAQMIAYVGGLIIPNPLNGAKIEGDGLGDIVGAYSKSHKENGIWKSVANSLRGTLKNNYGPVNIFDAETNLPDANIIANSGINSVINIDERATLWNNFTLQRKTSFMSKAHFMFTVLYIKKSLRPVLLPYIEEPFDIPTFKKIYNEVFPFLEDLKGTEKRAIDNYQWLGDQDARNLSSLVVNNNPSDVLLGKYKAILRITGINTIGIFELVITIEKSGTISFE